jgi:hypothetical protein
LNTRWWWRRAGTDVALSIAITATSENSCDASTTQIANVCRQLADK